MSFLLTVYDGGTKKKKRKGKTECKRKKVSIAIKSWSLSWVAFVGNIIDESSEESRIEKYWKSFIGFCHKVAQKNWIASEMWHIDAINQYKNE